MKVLALVLMLFGSAAGQTSPPETVQVNGNGPIITVPTVYLNGRVYTGTKPSWATAFVVSGGRILAIGTETEIRKAAGDDAPVIDLQGAFIMPGFNDAHTHLANGGFEKLNVNLIGANSLEEMKQRIADRVKRAKPQDWIVGRGWDHTKWTSKKLPTRQDLDRVTGEHPAVFTRVDGHISVANTAALKTAGVNASTKAPEGGSIDLDSNREPTGILRETAMALVGSKVPLPTKEQRRQATLLALEDAVRNGVTSAQDNSSWEDFLIYEELHSEGKLPIRITEWLPFDAPIERLKEMRSHRPPDDPMLRTGMLKGVMDGSLGSRTAAMLKPYSDAPKNSGLPRYTQEQLNQMTMERLFSCFQIGFHAIGDRGEEMALNAFAYASEWLLKRSSRPDDRPRCYTPTEARLRVEHAQVVDPKHFARFRQLDVIASMQPNHLLTDMDWAEQRIGSQRAKISYPWKQFLDSGVRLAFGTDYPVEPINPFRVLYAAVTRMNEQGTKKYPGNHAISIDQAIAAYTTGSAYAEFTEQGKGMLAPGMWADFVVLDRDITKAKPADILTTKVLRTVVGGKTVYQSE